MKPTLLIALLICNFAVSRAESPEEIARMNAALANWKTLTPEYLLLPENATLLDGLRQRAKDTSRNDVRVPLLRMDDADTIQSVFIEFHSKNMSRRRQAISQLTFAANPKVLPKLVDDLMKDASPKVEIIDGDVNAPSTSVVAAKLIRTTVLNSSEFSANAKAWAQTLPPDPVGLTEGVRVWWQQNREALEKGDFRSVLPDAVQKVETHGPQRESTPEASPRPAPQSVLSEARSTPPTPLTGVSSFAQDNVATKGGTEPEKSLWPWVFGVLGVMTIVTFYLRRSQK